MIQSEWENGTRTRRASRAGAGTVGGALLVHWQRRYAPHYTPEATTADNPLMRKYDRKRNRTGELGDHLMAPSMRVNDHALAEIT